MAEEKKKRNPRPTNLVRSTAYTTTDEKVFMDKKAAHAHQRMLDLTSTFAANPIAEGVEANTLFDYVKTYKKEFFALLRSIIATRD